MSVMTENGFEGYEAVMSISISEVLGMTFFSGNEILKVHVLLMVLATNFFYLVVYVDFLFWDGTSSFCLLGFASASIF